ncbi:uncharacterized protein LOC144923424 [Branchiostoma floridae x Branchiostoma belcheri]
MASLISVLHPYDYVCKQSLAAKSEGKYKRFRIYNIKVEKEEGETLLDSKLLVENTKQERDEGEELRQAVQRYINRLREEVADKFRRNSVPIKKFEEIAENLLKKDPARFSFATSKSEDCFVALVSKLLEESGDIKEMTIHFLEDGVKVEKNEGAVPRGEEGGAVGGAAEDQRKEPIATLILPQEWRNSFQKSLENNIHLCHGHIGPALEALRLGHNSYTDSERKTCNFNSSRGDRELVQGKKIFQSKLRYKLHGMNPHGKSTLCKVHLNGDGSDCYLVYVDRKYIEMGRVFLLVGVFTHSECGIKTGARKKEHGTRSGGSANIPDAALDMEAAEKYLQ